MITSGMKTYYIPANTQVYINNTALHTNPKHWGPDSLEFKPSRWIAEGSTIGNENLIIPAKGTFLPWSGGPRVCPGQKMSQVEFVSVLATIFRSCSIAPALADGESHEQGKERLQNVIAKSRPALTLQMTSPEQVKLRWSKR
jgi:cytochrome P450